MSKMLYWVNTPEGERILFPALDLNKSWDFCSTEGAGCSQDGLCVNLCGPEGRSQRAPELTPRDADAAASPAPA